jgi:hypothetical protein
VDAGHLSGRVCPTPLAPTGLCYRRTSGGQGVTKTTHHGSHPPRKFGTTRRSHRVDGGCQRLASCICPIPGLWSRRQRALPRSRVPLLKTCPALRPRWCPRYAPKRIEDCCLPVRAHRRLTTTLPISGLHHAASLRATPGSVRPLTGRHAGSLLTCWRDVSQMGLAPRGSHPLGNNHPLHGIAPNAKVSGFPWRDQCIVRCSRRSVVGPRHAARHPRPALSSRGRRGSQGVAPPHRRGQSRRGWLRIARRRPGGGAPPGSARA